MRHALPSRRRFLGGALLGAVVATAGCQGLFDDGSSRAAAGQRQLRLTLVSEDGPLHEHRVSASDDPPQEWADGAREAAIAGEAFHTQYRKPFFARPDDPVYVQHDGAFYELGSVVVDEARETWPVVRLTLLDEEADAPSTTPAEKLPETDQDAVRVAHMAARARGNDGGVPTGIVQRGGYVYRDSSAIDRSVLLADDGPEHVRYRDRTHSVSVSREVFYEPVYRATAERVAESPDRMEAVLRARFLDARIGPGDLSTAARDVLVQAMGSEGYAEPHPYSEGYAELLTELDERPYLDGNIEKDAGARDPTGLVRYDGDYYDYRLEFTTGSTTE